MKRIRFTLLLGITTLLFAVCLPAWAQKSYDDHELDDRFYITIGGFNQTDLRTTLRLDAKSPEAGIGIGTVIALESLFNVDNDVSTVRLDGWYRFGKKHRIAWTYWSTSRDGISTYDGEPIDVGDITINPGDGVTISDDSTLIAANWTYSFLNTAKYEAWLGIGLNTSSLDTTIDVEIGGGDEQFEESARGTVPVPTINIGGRWNFNKRVRMLLFLQMFGLEYGDYSGKLNNTRILCEWKATKHFGIGGGFERFAFELDAEKDTFSGSVDSSYTGLSLYLKGQI
jgi:hypothetical protein